MSHGTPVLSVPAGVLRPGDVVAVVVPDDELSLAGVVGRVVADAGGVPWLCPVDADPVAVRDAEGVSWYLLERPAPAPVPRLPGALGVEGLRGLPVGAVVRDADGWPYRLTEGVGWVCAGDFLPTGPGALASRGVALAWLPGEEVAP